MSSSTLPESVASRRPDLIRLAAVIVLALVIRTWIVRHAEVPARDGVGFIRIALQLQEKPWSEVIRRWEQHPGYPIAVLAMSLPVRAVKGMTPEAMVFSAQLVSLIAGILMVIPIYFLGKSLFDRNAGFVAAAILQCLPVFVLVTSDALSESLFLLLVCTALLFAVQAMRNPTVWRFFLSGFFSGLAYLTRPEGIETVAAIGLVLAIVGLTRWGLKATAIRASALAVGVMPLIALYVGITGHLTNKPTANDVMNGHATRQTEQVSVGSKLVFATFWDPQIQTGKSRMLWSLKSLLGETAKSFHYFTGAIAILGLWWYRRKLQTEPAHWVPVAFVLMHAALLWRMAVVIGYVSERHTLPIVLVGVFWAAAVLPAVGAWIGSRWRNIGRWLPATVAVALMLSGLPPIVKPLHGSRAGHHAAGVWMAKHITDRDEVIDPFAWAHYYSGCVFREGHDLLPTEHDRYVVLEPGSAHSRLTGMATAMALAEKGEPVYHSKGNTVVVYRIAAGH